MLQTNVTHRRIIAGEMEDGTDGRTWRDVRLESENAIQSGRSRLACQAALIVMSLLLAMKRTKRASLTMSVVRGRPEVAFSGPSGQLLTLAV